MTAARFVVLAVALACAALIGCGDDSNGSGSAAESEPAHIERANAICRDAIREVKRFGRTALERYDGEGLDLITEAFVKPGIPILERQAERLRRIERAADDPELTAYVELYDPVIELARERVSAARSADSARAREITGYMEELGEDGRLAARRAGLDDCDLDFQRVVVRATAER